MFVGTAEDDRSDNDENEFEEEQRMEAEDRERRALKEGTASPAVMLLNGQPMDGNDAYASAKSSGVKPPSNGSANRKENAPPRRKA